MNAVTLLGTTVSDVDSRRIVLDVGGVRVKCLLPERFTTLDAGERVAVTGALNVTEEGELYVAIREVQFVNPRRRAA